MMDGTMISLFRDYKHGKRLKPRQFPPGGNGGENVSAMPTILPRTQPRRRHHKSESYPQVEISKRLLCPATPPPSLQSQSLPKISLHGNTTRRQCRHSNRPSPKDHLGLVIPSIKYSTSQSLPSLLHSNSCGKSSGKRTKKDPQRSSTFDLFKTSKPGRRTATNHQNFCWDFSPRTEDAPKVGTNTKEGCLPKHSGGNVQSPRPVHLYMSVEMMDKLLEKRKGLRSDETLNELIGIPNTKARVSKSRNNKRHRRGDNIVNCGTVNDTGSQEVGTYPSDSDKHETASKEQGIQEDNHGDEMEARTSSQDADHHGNKMETESVTSSKEQDGEDYCGNVMEAEFQDDDDDEELGGLCDDIGSQVFDGCEDDEEEDEDDEERGGGKDEDDGEEEGKDDEDDDEQVQGGEDEDEDEDDNESKGEGDEEEANGEGDDEQEEGDNEEDKDDDDDEGEDEEEEGEEDGEMGEDDGEEGEEDGEMGEDDGEDGEEDGEMGEEDGEMGEGFDEPDDDATDAGDSDHADDDDLTSDGEEQ